MHLHASEFVCWELLSLPKLRWDSDFYTDCFSDCRKLNYCKDPKYSLYLLNTFLFRTIHCSFHYYKSSINLDPLNGNL